MFITLRNLITSINHVTPRKRGARVDHIYADMPHRLYVTRLKKEAQQHNMCW